MMPATFFFDLSGFSETSRSTLETMPVSNPSFEIQEVAMPCNRVSSVLHVWGDRGHILEAFFTLRG